MPDEKDWFAQQDDDWFSQQDKRGRPAPSDESAKPASFGDYLNALVAGTPMLSGLAKTGLAAEAGAKHLKENPEDILPVVGGSAAALASGGVLAPIALAAAGSGAGSLARSGVRALRGKEDAPTDVREALRTAAGDAALGAGGQALGMVATGAKPFLKKAARRVYQGALKPTKAVLNRVPGSSQMGQDGARDVLVEQGLKNRVAVGTQGGIDKVEGLKDALDDAVQGQVNVADARGVTIDPARIESRLNDTEKFFSETMLPDADTAQIRAARESFRNNENVTVPNIVPKTSTVNTGILDASGNPITRAVTSLVQDGRKYSPTSIRKVFDMRRNTDAASGRRMYGELKGASAEAEKALTRGAREEVASAIPGLAENQHSYSQLISLQDALEDAARRSGNRDFIGIGGKLAIAGHNKLLGAAAESVTGAPMQSRAAIGMNELSKALPDLDYRSAVRSALLALMASRDE